MKVTWTNYFTESEYYLPSIEILGRYRVPSDYAVQP